MVIYPNGDGDVNRTAFSYSAHMVGMEHNFTVRTLTDSHAIAGIYELCIPPISRGIMSRDTPRKSASLTFNFVHPILSACPAPLGAAWTFRLLVSCLHWRGACSKLGVKLTNSDDLCRTEEQSLAALTSIFVGIIHL